MEGRTAGDREMHFVASLKAWRLQSCSLSLLRIGRKEGEDMIRMGCVGVLTMEEGAVCWQEGHLAGPQPCSFCQGGCLSLASFSAREGQWN